VAFLDHAKVGRIGFVDVDARNPLHVLRVSQKPVLDIGAPGTFDDNGVTPMCIIPKGNRLLLYYTGWQLGVNVRYYLFTGLATSADGGETFERYSRVPVLDRSDKELFVRTAVHVHADGNNWRMWYIGGDRWVTVGSKQVPSYNMRCLDSSDGYNWPETGAVCLDVTGPDEYGFGRPYVLRQADRYQMWYSIRTFSKGYRLGYAESADGVNWTRMDDRVGIDVSPSGWDSEMICYSVINETPHGTYMFYNGNNYGETGFGCAVLESAD
jgi:hypothetical protein